VAIAFARRPAALSSSAGITEVSRFSCMKFPGVLWVLRLRGTVQELAVSLLPMLPSAFPIASASPLRIFEAQSPSPPVPLFTLHQAPRGAWCKTRGRVDRYSFLVRLLHSLLHAGLSRRTGICSAALRLCLTPRRNTGRTRGWPSTTLIVVLNSQSLPYTPPSPQRHPRQDGPTLRLLASSECHRPP